MKKLLYIVIAFVLFLSFTAVNVFAGEVDKAKQGDILNGQNIMFHGVLDLTLNHIVKTYLNIVF